MRLLTNLLLDSAARCPDRVAISDAAGELSYGALDALTNRMARALRELGVQRGDRVGIWLNKSATAVATMQAALRIGAVYVPVDSLAPAERLRTIASACDVAALVTTVDGADEAAAVGLDVKTVTTGARSNGLCWSDVESLSSEPLPPVSASEDDLAYILFTSGSTGTPKGVCISHLNARAFVDWAVDVLEVTAEDRFANHAPFHFDLSVLDLYGAFSQGASVHIVPESASYHARHLVDFIEQRRISIWYSVPSALVMMEGAGLSTLARPPRALIFAGEVYPIKHLRQLRADFPSQRLLNFYGPTETNVCTFYEVPRDLSEQLTPVPIGTASCGDRVWAEKADGDVAVVGEEGELIVDGPTVMLGYWGRPPHSGPYRTGDIVRVQDGQSYNYVGRRDHMVKVRGHRVELGEIEAALSTHASVHECVVVVEGEGLTAKLLALVVAKGERPSLLDLKQHCASRLPRYMIVDRVVHLEALPRTPNGKVDRNKLLADMGEVA